MLGTVRNVDGTNQPFTIAGLSDGSTDIVHRECNEEYQIPMAVDCQYGAGYLGITDCCKFLFNPTTGVAKVDCIDTTVTCVDINNNSNIGSNQPILAQGFDEDSLYDNSVEKTTVVYNANCYLCNDPTTGDPVCKPVLKATTFCADEYLGIPKDYPVKYVATLPVSPDIEDYIYSYDETESLVGKPLKVIRDKYFGAANTKCIVLNGKTVADIGANYTYWTDTDGTSYMSTQDSSYSDSCVVETAFKAGDATNQLLYDIGSGEGGEGSLELSNLPTSGTANLAFVDQYGKIAYCDTGVQACKDSSGDLVLKRENLTTTFSPTGFTESSEDASNNCRQTLDEANGFRRAICCGNRCSIVNQDKSGFTTTSYTDPDISWVSSNIDCPIYAVQNRNGIETSLFRTGINYNNTGACTKDFEVKSYCSGLRNDLKFNTDLRYCKFGLSYTGCNNVNGSYNDFRIGNGGHFYSETNCAATNIGGDCCYTVNTYVDDTWAYNNRLKTIKSKAAEENTYKQLEWRTHLNTSVHDSSIRYECIEMTYSCVCCGNTCFEGKTKYCTTNGKWYVCCDSTKGYKCLLNEDEMPTASVSVNANNDDAWYSLVGTTNHTDLIYSCANSIIFHPEAGRIQAVGGFTNDNSVILCVEHTNELNIIPGSGTDTWINYRGGSNNVYIGNGDGSNNGWGTLHAALVDSNLKGRIMMNDGYCATYCNFMPYSGTAGVYGIGEGDWMHALTFAHGDFNTYYGTAVQVPFWDNQRFTWRVRANGTLCGIHELLDNRGGQRVNGDFYLGCNNYYVQRDGVDQPVALACDVSGAGMNWLGGTYDSWTSLMGNIQSARATYGVFNFSPAVSIYDTTTGKTFTTDEIVGTFYRPDRSGMFTGLIHLTGSASGVRNLSFWFADNNGPDSGWTSIAPIPGTLYGSASSSGINIEGTV